MEKQYKFYDLQTGIYSEHTTVDGLYEMLKKGYCECGEGYDLLDTKDGKMKCRNCKDLNNIDTVSEEQKKDYIIESEYSIEEPWDGETINIINKIGG